MHEAQTRWQRVEYYLDRANASINADCLEAAQIRFLTALHIAGVLDGQTVPPEWRALNIKQMNRGDLSRTILQSEEELKKRILKKV